MEKVVERVVVRAGGRWWRERWWFRWRRLWRWTLEELEETVVEDTAVELINLYDGVDLEVVETVSVVVAVADLGAPRAGMLGGGSAGRRWWRTGSFKWARTGIQVEAEEPSKSCVRRHAMCAKRLAEMALAMLRDEEPGVVAERVVRLGVEFRTRCWTTA